MTPAEHYAEAERLAEAVVDDQSDRTPPGDENRRTGIGDSGPWTDRCIALAQVHATLATVPEGRAVLAAEGQAIATIHLKETNRCALRELRSVLEEFGAVSSEGARAMRAQMPQTAFIERMNRLAALDRGDLVAYQAAQR